MNSMGPVPKLDLTAPPSSPAAATASFNLGGLAPLDLSSVTNRETSPDELQKRRAKYARFQNKCSEILPGLYCSGQSVAEDKALLKSHGITHIISCIGASYRQHSLDFVYLNLQLADSENQEIVDVLHTVISFIEGAREGDGRVLVHCTQGVSRGPALLIAYIMWKQKVPYEAAFLEVKTQRGVANPNLGFICQLIQWHTSCLSCDKQAYSVGKCEAVQGESRCLPRILLNSPDLTNASQIYIFKSQRQLHLWMGSEASQELINAATDCVRQIAKLHTLPAVPILMQSGGAPRRSSRLLRKTSY